MVLIDDGG